MYKYGLSYFSKKLELRKIPEKGGLGVFAIDNIELGEHLVTFTGKLLSFQELIKLPKKIQSLSLQIDDNLYLVSLTPEPADYVNHSCNPNAGMADEKTLIAIKNIKIGEEICFDYAMTDSSEYDEFDCYCGSPQCRGKMTRDDWKRPELWQRYQGYFSPYLARHIEQLTKPDFHLIPLN